MDYLVGQLTTRSEIKIENLSSIFWRIIHNGAGELYKKVYKGLWWNIPHGAWSHFRCKEDFPEFFASSANFSRNNIFSRNFKV